MTDKNRHNQQDESLQQENLMRYLRGEMTAEEQHELERSTDNDPFTAEALEGWEKIQQEQIPHIISDIQAKTRQQLSQKKRRRRPIKADFWLSITIIIVLLLIGIAYWIISKTIHT